MEVAPEGGLKFSAWRRATRPYGLFMNWWKPGGWAALALVVSLAHAWAEPSVVKVEQKADGGWQLLRDGKPYLILGAGGVDHLDLLVKYGGNSIRTWGVAQLEEKDASGKTLLDRAHELGLTVAVGLWVKQPRQGLYLDNPAQVEKQRAIVRAAVRKHKDHPAVLVWGLGNEVEIQRQPEEYPQIFRELNELAKIVKEEDPNHPVMTVLAGPQDSKIAAILAEYPNIDILGMNAYGAGPDVPRKLKEAGWKKPYVLTEYGPKGQWELNKEKTSWGVAPEPTSTEKAESYRKSYEANVKDFSSHCLGSYAFKWGYKQETTATWFGLFLNTGEKTPSVDTLAHCWTGRWPKNRSPMIEKVEAKFSEKIVAPNEEFTLHITASDPENDPLATEVWVMEEAKKPNIGGDKEVVPDLVEGCLTTNGPMHYTMRTPTQTGNYRAFVKVRDGQGGASVQSLPFRVE